MKNLLVFLFIFLFLTTLLSACGAPLHDIEEDGPGFAKKLTAKPLDNWVIILCAVSLIIAGTVLILKMITKPIKLIAILILVLVIAGAAYGLSKIPVYEKARDVNRNTIEVCE